MNLFNPVYSRLSAVAWITGWKILDTISTVSLPNWQAAEVNLLVHTFSASLGAETTLYLLVPMAAVLTYLCYNWQPFFVEAFAIIIPLITVGNFIQTRYILFGSLWNLATPLLTMYMYHRIQPELLFFDSQQPDPEKYLKQMLRRKVNTIHD